MVSNRMRLTASALAVTAVTLCPVSQSQAFLGAIVAYLGFDVEAGLDSATLDFLNKYPPKIREQAVLGTKEILDRTDQSVANVFKEGRDLILLTLDSTKCALNNGKALPRGMLESLFGIRPNYTKIVDEELGALQRKTSLSTTPKELYQQYVGVDNIASNAYCLTLQADLEQHSILLQRAEVKTSYLLWRRMEPLCTSVSSCYALVASTVDVSLKSALPQDLLTIKAQERLAEIKRPPEVRRTLFSSNFNLVDYERALNGLLGINDDLIRASTKRFADGLAARGAYDAAYKTLNVDLQRAAATGDATAACNQGYKLASSVQAVKQLEQKLARYEIYTQSEWNEITEMTRRASEAQQKLVGRKSSGRFVNDGSSCRTELNSPRRELQPKCPSFRC